MEDGFEREIEGGKEEEGEWERELEGKGGSWKGDEGSEGDRGVSEWDWEEFGEERNEVERSREGGEWGRVGDEKGGRDGEEREGGKEGSRRIIKEDGEEGVEV